MPWNYNKRTRDKTRAELELEEVFDYVAELECKLRKIEAVVDSLMFKAQVSHSLIVVRKIDESKIEELDNILD